MGPCQTIEVRKWSQLEVSWTKIDRVWVWSGGLGVGDMILTWHVAWDVSTLCTLHCAHYRLLPSYTVHARPGPALVLKASDPQHPDRSLIQALKHSASDKRSSPLCSLLTVPQHTNVPKASIDPKITAHHHITLHYIAFFTSYRSDWRLMTQINDRQVAENKSCSGSSP